MIENLVGLHVVDNEQYKKYRKEMMPILTSMGGGFRYDVTVAEILKSETENKINRIFIIYFPDEQVKAEFFNNKEYKIAKEKYFESAVTSVTLISEYTK